MKRRVRREVPGSAELAAYAAEYAAAARAGDELAAELLRYVESHQAMLRLSGDCADLFLEYARFDYGVWLMHAAA